MKYIAVIETDEKPVSCEFIGCNGNVAPYLLGATTSIKQAPEPMDNYEVGSFRDGYNQALKDCGVLKDKHCKIGDEVYLSSLNEKYTRVVLSTYATNDSIGWVARTMLPSGSIDVVPISCLKRTGRNFSQIAEVQKQLKEVWYGNN